MDNYEIADQLSMLSKLMDIHGENSFKSKSYSVAAFTIEKLPQEITSRHLLEKALEKKIIFVPGDTFYVSNPDTQTLRLNYSNVEENTMRKAMQTLGELFAG